MLPRLSVFLYAITLSCFANAQLITDVIDTVPPPAKLVLQVSYNYHFLNHFDYASANEGDKFLSYGGLFSEHVAPSLMVSYTHKVSPGKSTFHLTHGLGYKEYATEITVAYDGVPDPDNPNRYTSHTFEQTQYKKREIYHRLELKLSAGPAYLGPIFQTNAVLSHRFEKTSGLEKIGMYDANIGRLHQTPRFNFAVGFQMGATFLKRFQFGGLVLLGASPEYTYNGETWTRRQGAVYLNFIILK